MDIHVESLHPDPFVFNRDSHHHHHLPLPDFSSDDSPPQFSEPLSPKHPLKDLDDLHSKQDYQSQHSNELLDDFIGAPHSPSPVGSPIIRESEEPHSLPDLSHSSGSSDVALFTPIIPLALPPGGTTVIDGVTYNNRGYEVCGALNKFNKPCQRIGRCPFHPDHNKKTETPLPPPTTTATTTEGSTGPAPTAPAPAPTPEPRRFLPIKKGPYKSGWKKDEHLRFLKGLQIHGKGSWKDIALIVGTRTPTQIQVHAHRYYLRQQQGTKNKRSIHDISLEDLEELEVQHGSIMPTGPQSPLLDDSTELSPMFPPPPFNNSNPTHNIHSPPSSPISHSPIHANPPFSVSNTNSTNFPPLFSSSSSNSTLPGLLPLPLPLPGNSNPFPMNYHSSPSWFHFSSMPPMGSDIGDDNLAGLHLPPPTDHKYSFSQDDYEDDEDLTDFGPNHVPLHDADDDTS